MRNIFFWPYQALPGLTGPDRAEPVGALERWSVGALERWSVGALERWGEGGDIVLIELI